MIPVALTDDLATKYTCLCSLFAEMGSVIIGYSGGIDSTLLAKVAGDTLGTKGVAMLAISPSLPRHEWEEARSLAQSVGFPYEEIEAHEMEREGYRRNEPDRCYFCKTELYTVLWEEAVRRGVRWVADGQNADDTADFRPGGKAAHEQGVRSPLREAGLTKADIRALARELGLPNWNKPAAACLSSRIPYGTPVTIERLTKVERGEKWLLDLGFRQFRVRHHEDLARLEFAPDELPRLLDAGLRGRIVQGLKEAGYTFVTVDLQGYRTGSLNERLSAESKAEAMGSHLPAG